MFDEFEFNNNWTLDNQGDRYTINISEFDQVLCGESASNSGNQTHNVNASINVSFYKPIFINGSLSYSYSHTNTITQNTSYSAPSIVDCETIPITYCTQQDELQDYLFGTVMHVRIGAEIKENNW